MYLYVCSVQYVVSLLFAAICHFLIIRLIIFNILVKFFLCCIFFYSVFLHCLVLFLSFSIRLSLYYFFTSLLTTEIRRRPNSSK